MFILMMHIMSDYIFLIASKFVELIPIGTYISKAKWSGLLIQS